MIYNVYSIRDEKVAFQNVFHDVNDESALRGFSYAVNNGGLINYAPADFSLYRVGTFDSESGAIAPVSPLVLIAHGSDCVGVEHET